MPRRVPGSALPSARPRVARGPEGRARASRVAAREDAPLTVRPPRVRSPTAWGRRRRLRAAPAGIVVRPSGLRFLDRWEYPSSADPSPLADTLILLQARPTRPQQR